MTRAVLVDLEAERNLGLTATGLVQGVVYRRFIAAEAISIGHALTADTTTAGRVKKTTSQNSTVVGVAMDAASGAGDSIRVALGGVAQVFVASAATVALGDTLGLSATAGHATSGANTAINTSRGLVGTAIEASASGSNRLVWANIWPGMSRGSSSPSAGYPVDVAATEDDGADTAAARADHRHAHGTGYAGGHTDDVATLAKSGATGLTGAVTLSEGSGVTLTQVGNDIAIAATGGGGAHTHDEDDLIPDTVEAEELLGLGTTGLVQNVLYRKFVAAEAIPVGYIVTADTTTAGRVLRATGASTLPIGVAMDAAAAAGDTIRVAIIGVVQVMVLTSVTVTIGDYWRASGSAGRATNVVAVAGNASNVHGGIYLESSASGADRLVWVYVNPSRQSSITMPGAGYPIDVAATEDDGVSTTFARDDHRHAHGSGYAGGHSDILTHGSTAHTGTVTTGVPFSAGATIVTPASGTTIMVWRAPFACTVTNVRGHRKGGTGATINARKNQASDHLASALSLTSTDTWMDGGAVQNTSLAAGDDLEVMVVTVAGAPTEVAVQVDLTRSV